MPDATPQGAPAANNAPATIPDLNDPNLRLGRNDAYAAMVARRRDTVFSEMTAPDADALRASRAAESQATDRPAGEAAADPDPDIDPADAEAERERARLATESAAPATAAERVARQRADEPIVISDEDLPNYLVRTKVLGEERLVPLNELRTSAQKTDSADGYLRTASELLKEVKQTVAQAKAPAPAAAPANNDTDPERKPSAEPDPIDAAVDGIFTGNDEQVRDQLRKALTGRGNATPGNAEQIARAVEQRIVIRSALKQFAKEHKAIVEDPLLRRVADGFLSEATGGRSLEELEPDQIPDALETAATRTKEWLRAKTGVAAPAPANSQPRVATSAERRARKESIDELPAAGARQSTVVPRPQGTSETIAKMAANRPGHVAVPS